MPAFVTVVDVHDSRDALTLVALAVKPLPVPLLSDENCTYKVDPDEMYVRPAPSVVAREARLGDDDDAPSYTYK